MKLHFTKMHGLGNDFMVIDATQHPLKLSPAIIRQWADRHRGIGFDQLLLVTPSTSTDIDFGYQIFNSDGNEVSQCGNGARCLAKFIQQRLSKRNPLRVATHQSIMELSILQNGLVKISLPSPIFNPTQIPLIAEEAKHYTFSTPQGNITAGAVSLGNPHIVTQVEDIHAVDVSQWGSTLGQLAIFPEGVNVGFMQVLAENKIKLRVYERGAGETLACGSGACAAVAIGQQWGLLAPHVEVELLGGVLAVEWQGKGQPINLVGPAEEVYEGEVTI